MSTPVCFPAAAGRAFPRKYTPRPEEGSPVVAQSLSPAYATPKGLPLV